MIDMCNTIADPIHMTWSSRASMSPQQIVNESRQKVEVNSGPTRENNVITVSDTITKTARETSLLIFAIKEDMREFREDPTTMPRVVMYKGEVLLSNDNHPLSPSVSTVLQEYDD